MPTPTRSGYTLAGWFTAVSGGTQISSSTVINSNVTYYAHWVVQASITVTNNGQAEKRIRLGSSSMPGTITYGCTGYNITITSMSGVTGNIYGVFVSNGTNTNVRFLLSGSSNYTVSADSSLASSGEDSALNKTYFAYIQGDFTSASGTLQFRQGSATGTLLYSISNLTFSTSLSR